MKSISLCTRLVAASRPLVRFHALRRGAFVLSMTAAASAWSADAASDCLYRRFDISAGDAWGKNEIELSPGDWRIGNPQGAPVDEAGLKRHLAESGRLIIGGVCAGTSEGETYRACGFSLALPALAGRPQYDASRQWQSTTGTLLVSPTEADDSIVISAFSTQEAAPRDGLPEHFVGMQAPLALLEALHGAYGATLRFGFRAVSNPLTHSTNDANPGFVVLCSAHRGLTASRRPTQHPRDDSIDVPRIQSWPHSLRRRRSPKRDSRTLARVCRGSGDNRP